jgi:4-hydroxybenzoate polyprenyltransferase
MDLLHASSNRQWWRLQDHVMSARHSQSLIIQTKHWANIAFRMLRLRTVLVMLTFAAIGYEATQPSKSISLDFIFVAIMISALYMCATCFNDIADEEIDKVNLPNDASRPLVTTNTTSSQLKKLGLIALFIAFISAAAIKPAYMLFVIFGAALNIFYSIPPLRVSYRGIFASLWLSLSYVTIPFLAGGLLNEASMSRTSWYILAAMYSCFVGRILLKDFRDYEGDKKFGKLNFLVRHGAKLTCAVSGLAWLIGDIFITVGLYSKFPTLVCLIQPFVLIIFYKLHKLSNEKRYKLKLLEVSIIGRMGNAIALSLLARLTLRAYGYSEAQNNLITITVGVFIAATAIYLWQAYSAQTDKR